MAELREALESAITEVETKEEVAPSTPEVEAAAPSEPSDLTERSSVVEDDQSQETQNTEVSDKPDDSKEVAAKPAEAKPAEAPTKQSRVDRAPASWKGQAKGEWASVPLAIRQEIHRREMQVEKVMQETAPLRQFQQQFSQTVAPFQARMNDLGVNPVQAIHNLLEVDHVLSHAPKTDRAKFMAKLIRDYGIDFIELDRELSGTPSQAAPVGEDIEQRILQRVQQVVAPILQEREQAVVQQRQQVVNTVESMADNPDFPYFNDVRQDMADIIDISVKKGVAITLQQAYTKAVRMNDEIVSQLERQSTVNGANQQHAQAQKAKAAASSVTGAPAFGGTGSFQGDGSLRSSLEAAFNSNRV